MTHPYPGRPKRKGTGEAAHVASGLSGAIGPLMRQMRKFAALRACLDLLPAELSGLAAPYDVRLASAEEYSGKRASGGFGNVSTMFVYVANRTVEAVLTNDKPRLIKAINAALPVELVEDLRFEEVSLKKITRQMNIIAAEPD